MINKYQHLFDQELVKTGFYVYAFMTEDREIFYIGKGKRNRCFNHFSDSSLKYTNMKNNKIKSILKRGEVVLIDLLVWGLENEDTAFEVEEHLIESYGVKREGGLLTNHSKVRGGYEEYSYKGQSAAEKGQKTKRLKYSEEERKAWAEKANTPISRIKKGIASKRMWESWTEEERQQHIHPFYRNGAIQDYTFWYLADLIYCICQKYPNADRHQLAFLFKDKGKSKVFESLRKAFLKGWNPLEDEGYLEFLNEHGRQRKIITDFTLHPLAEVYLDNHINARTRMYISPSGEIAIGRHDMCKAYGVAESRYRRLKKEYDKEVFPSFGELVEQTENFITDVRYTDGTCSPLPV